jgi:hypothetical protein
VVTIMARVDALLTGRLHRVHHGLLSVGQEALELRQLLRAQVEALEEGAVGRGDAALHLDREELLEFGVAAQGREGAEAPAPAVGTAVAARAVAGLLGTVTAVPATPHGGKPVLERLDRLFVCRQLAL